ncbi:MAG: response regulator [Bryobacterales bacterium]|nr:response regulator [Bryobacterales bacterium]
MAARNPSLATTHARILLVDDNANGLAARRSVLEELGHRITTATSGGDALELFSTHKFDLVVTDYKMPKMDGLDLIIRLRKQLPDLPIILISGYVDALGMNEASTGADAVIQKSSHEVSHLVRSVNRLLRRKPAARKPAAAQSKPAKRKAV